ncbi:MAG: dual specificity protein phosphatase family protein [Sedimentisphaerales bacterium]|jgi:protein tyrosine/serine phosphatase
MNLNASFRTEHKWVFVAVPAIVIGLAIWAWFGGIEYHFIPKNFGVVEQGHIYRSGQISAKLIKKILKEHNIKVIINLTSMGPNNPDKRAEEKAAAELNIKVLRFPMSGNGTGDINDYAAAVAAIADAEKQNLPVLVHCVAGAARTGGIIATYRLLVQKIDPNIVEDELEKYSYAVDKKTTLRLFLNNNMAAFASRLKQAGVIDQIPATIPQIPRD